jgi:hypothetical protein
MIKGRERKIDNFRVKVDLKLIFLNKVKWDVKYGLNKD